MNKYTLKGNESGLHFVQGQGFVAGCAGEATKLTDAEVAQTQACLKQVGGEASTAVVFNPAPVGAPAQFGQNGSYSVSFIRPKDLNNDGSIKRHKLNPSKRRFATLSEAQQHGTRFTRIEGHLGYYTLKTNDPVNAWINTATGKTNPEIGRARTNRN